MVRSGMLSNRRRRRPGTAVSIELTASPLLDDGLTFRDLTTSLLLLDSRLTGPSGPDCRWPGESDGTDQFALYSATQSISMDSGELGQAQPEEHQVCCWRSSVIGWSGIAEVLVTVAQIVPSTV